MTVAVATETLKIIAADADALALMRDVYVVDGVLWTHIRLDIAAPLARVAADVTDPYAHNEIMALLSELELAPYRTIGDTGAVLRSVIRSRLS